MSNLKEFLGATPYATPLCESVSLSNLPSVEKDGKGCEAKVSSVTWKLDSETKNIIMNGKVYCNVCDLTVLLGQAQGENRKLALSKFIDSSRDQLDENFECNNNFSANPELKYPTFLRRQNS